MAHTTYNQTVSHMFDQELSTGRVAEIVACTILELHRERYEAVSKSASETGYEKVSNQIYGRLRGLRYCCTASGTEHNHRQGTSSDLKGVVEPT